MTKPAFTFPDRAARLSAWGTIFAQTYPEARAVFEEVDDALGVALSKIMFEGPEDPCASPKTPSPR